MPIEITLRIISKLDSPNEEIRCLALDSIASKIRTCDSPLDDIEVNLKELLRHLIRWFSHKPLTKDHIVLTIILSLLKSKFSDETKSFLKSEKMFGKIQSLMAIIKTSSTKELLNEIIFNLQNSNDIEKKITKNELNLCTSTSNNMDNINMDRYKFTQIWETPDPVDQNLMSVIKNKLHSKLDQQSLDSSMRYFGRLVKDYPGEYFLQSPFLFEIILKLIQDENEFNKIQLLGNCLLLTKNLFKRVEVRQLSKTYYCTDRKNEIRKMRQVSIGTYCYETFKVILEHLKDIIFTNKLENINHSFLILIELIELICLSAGKFTPNIIQEYRINTILNELIDLLQYIRETTQNYRDNVHSIQRNNSISLIYLICRLIMFMDDIEDVKQIDLQSKKSKEILTKKNEYVSAINQMSVCNDYDGSQNESFASAFDNTFHGDSNHLNWAHELEIALLDYPLRHFYPDVCALIELTLKIESQRNRSFTKELLNISVYFKPIIKIMKEPQHQSDKTIINDCLMSSNVLALIQNEELIKKIFTSITNLIPEYDGNELLKKNAENLLLKLFTDESIDLKRQVYRLASEKIAHFICSIMNGRTIISKYHTKHNSECTFFGLPMTDDILNEIISSGLSSNDSQIRLNAENIIALILRSRKYLQKFKNEINNCLIPSLPMLLCYSSRKSTLGHSILEIPGPDSDNNLNQLELKRGNILLLFSHDSSVRNEAVYRLSYLLQSAPNAASYVPNINYLTDTIPNNLCIVDVVTCPKRNNYADLYETSNIPTMIKLLNTPNIEPSICRTTIIQLKIMLQDPKISEYFCQLNGLSTIIRIFDETLRNRIDTKCKDIILPIVSILSQLCLQMSAIRETLSNDLNIYDLILRSLFLYHGNEQFKSDCSILLFVLVFATYISNEDKCTLLLPYVCKKLYIPFKCNFHHHKNILKIKNILNIALLNNENNNNDNINATMDDKENIWRYVRMCFASIWYDGLDKIDEKEKNDQINFIQYKCENDQMVNLNQKLCITKDDLIIITSTSPQKCIRAWLKKMRNACTYEHVILCCSAIENYSNVDSVNHKKWNCDLFLSAMKRLCLTPPQNSEDEMIFIKIINLLINLIERDFRDILCWLLNEFQQKKCIFLHLLTKININIQLYTINVKLIEITIEKANELQSKKSIDYLLYATTSKIDTDDTRPTTIHEKLFNLINNQLNNKYDEQHFEQLKSIASLLRVVTSSNILKIDDYTISYLANKLIKLIVQQKLFKQFGSNLSKNCLLIIGNLMIKTNEIKINDKSIRILSTLCGHLDFEIRAFTWTILAKISTTLNGAEQLIKELSFLPAGFHACCLSTLLDLSEPAIVREYVGYTFSTLISYRMANGQLSSRVEPKSANSTIEDNHLDKLIQHYKLFDEIASSLSYFHADQFIDQSKNFYETNAKLTSCEIIRAYCIILCNLLQIKNLPSIDMVGLTMRKMIRIIPNICASINESSIHLLSDLCSLIVLCFQQNEQYVDRICQENQIINSLLITFDESLFNEISENSIEECWSEIMIILKWITRSSVGFQNICEFYDQNPEYICHLFNLFTRGLSTEDMKIPVLRLLTNILVASQLNDAKFYTVVDHLLDLKLNDEMETLINKLITDEKIRSQSIVDLLDTFDDEKEIYAVDILLKMLIDLFESNKSIDLNKVHDHTCKALFLLLKVSPRARRIATDGNVILKVAQQMEAKCDEIGMNSQNFVRKHGNAKTDKIMRKLRLLLNIIINWYSTDCIQCVDTIKMLLPIFNQMWPILKINYECQEQYLKMILFLSDDSLPFCNLMSANMRTKNGSGSQNLLEMIIGFCMNETGKVKTPQTNLNALDIGLRIVSNCCSCIEGRLLISKMNMMHTLSKLHPQVTRLQKPWPTVTLYWLRFYEVFTRYHDGKSTAHNLNLLRNLFNGNFNYLRQIALQIIRNMAFNKSNRSELLTSDDFLCIVYNVLDDGKPFEQLLIVTSIWKLIAQNFKGKNAIKNSKIYEKLLKLNNAIKKMDSNQMCGNENDKKLQMEVIDDLKSALDSVMTIL